MGENGLRWAITAAMVTVAVAMAGCGGSSGHGSGAPPSRGSLLERTFARVRDDPSVQLLFEFGDVAAQRKLAGVRPAYGAGHPAERWKRILGFGTDYFGLEDPSGFRDGLDVLTGSIAVVIGRPPHTGGLITGSLVDGPKVRAAVEKLGAVPGTVDGRAGLTWGKEGSQHLAAVNAFGIGPGLGEFDRAIINPHTVIAGRFASEVRTLAGGGSRSAAADPTLAATFACLGDVVAAMGESATAGGASVEVAVGVRRPAVQLAPAQEVLCVASSRGATRPAGTALCSRIGPGGAVLPGSQEPPSQLASAARPEGGQTDRTRWAGCVVTDRATVQAGWLLDVEAHARDVGALAGL